MPIALTCICGKTLHVDEKYRGKKAKCPSCGNVMVVEDKAAPPPTADANTKKHTQRHRFPLAA